jgi:hypothetical protein
VPGLRSTIVYWPLPSVTADRVFSIRAGLAASTVTPGRTAPDASLTTPAIDPWADATAGRIASHVNVERSRVRARMRGLSFGFLILSTGFLINAGDSKH